MDETSVRSSGFGIIRKRQVVAPLRPAPLFRALALTGLPAGLPPHRRLRLALNSSSAHSPAQTPLPNIYNPRHEEKQPQTVRARHRHHGGRLNSEKEEYLFEEVWREQRPRVPQHAKKEAADLSLWLQRMEITDKTGHGCGKGAWPLRKQEELVGRDRRPHFLPPITQSDGLLHVPLLLPENSPPPSPRSPSDIFFPLTVPQIHRPITEETLPCSTNHMAAKSRAGHPAIHQ